MVKSISKNRVSPPNPYGQDFFFNFVTITSIEITNVVHEIKTESNACSYDLIIKNYTFKKNVRIYLQIYM